MSQLEFPRERRLDTSNIDRRARGTARVSLPDGATVESLDVGFPGFCSDMMNMNGNIVAVEYDFLSEDPDEFLFYGWNPEGYRRSFLWKPEWLTENTLPMPGILEADEEDA